MSSQGRLLGEIGHGVVALVGITHSDGEVNARRLAGKVAKLRIFGDDLGKMNLSLTDVGGAVLAVSQFTLYGDARSGNRPSYVAAARPEQALPLFDAFVAALREANVPVETGEFGAEMQVELINDGPVTLLLDSDDL